MIENSKIVAYESLVQELERVRYRKRYMETIRSTIFILITIAAFALLIATLLLPVVQVYSQSMSPSVAEDSIVFCVKDTKPEQGDVLAFYYNNKILIRRVIGEPGHKVEVQSSGRVLVDGKPLNESYVDTVSYGKCDLAGTYTVPGGQYFVLGDNREDTTDSRQQAFGCISEEDFIGRVVFCVWPLSSFGFVH